MCPIYLLNIWWYNSAPLFSGLFPAGGTWPSCLWSSATCWLKSKPSSLEDSSRETLSGSQKLMLLTSGGDFLKTGRFLLSELMFVCDVIVCWCILIVLYRETVCFLVVKKYSKHPNIMTWGQWVSVMQTQANKPSWEQLLCLTSFCLPFTSRQAQDVCIVWNHMCLYTF